MTETITRVAIGLALMAAAIGAVVLTFKLISPDAALALCWSPAILFLAWTLGDCVKGGKQ